MSEIDMRRFANQADVSLNFPAGSIIFNEGDAGDVCYVVQSGVIEMLIHGRVVDTCGPTEAMGFMSVIDGMPRTTTARVKEAADVSVIDKRKFIFMIGEVPNFAKYIMDSMAHRIRGMGRNIG